MYAMAAKLHSNFFTTNATTWVVPVLHVLKQGAQGCTWMNLTGQIVGERYFRSIVGRVPGMWKSVTLLASTTHEVGNGLAVLVDTVAGPTALESPLMPMDSTEVPSGTNVGGRYSRYMLAGGVKDQ